MNLLENYLDTIQQESFLGLWNIGGAEGITIGKMGDNISFHIGSDGEFMLKAGGGVVAASVLALVFMKISVSIYKNFINKYGKQCRGRKGYERTRCIERVKVAAMENRVKVLDTSKEKCKISKEPQKCVSKLQSKIDNINNSIKIKQAALAKVQKGA